jgi:hypothetical protein
MRQAIVHHGIFLDMLARINTRKFLAQAASLIWLSLIGLNLNQPGRVSRVKYCRLTSRRY